MLETLLESRSRTSRSPLGTIVSVTAHTALIAGALYATAQARVSPSGPPTAVRPIYFPSAPPSRHPVLRSRLATNSTMPTIRKPLVFVPRWNIDAASPIDVSSLASRPTDFPTSTMAGSGESGPLRAGADSSGALWNADQVEKQVALVPGSLPPRYPESLRSAGVEGEVVAVFVVDESGRAEQSGVRFLRSDNRLFEEAVRAALGEMRFAPAEVGGRKVRQLVQMPFVFTLRKY